MKRINPLKFLKRKPKPALMEGLPLQYAGPSPAMLEDIARYMMQLPLVALEDAMDVFLLSYEESDIVRSDRASAINRLREGLYADRTKRILESDEQPGTFDYEIDNFLYKNILALDVLTRLISPDPSHGKIMYGVVIYRIGEDEFVYEKDYG